MNINENNTKNSEEGRREYWNNKIFETNLLENSRKSNNSGLKRKSTMCENDKKKDDAFETP